MDNLTERILLSTGLASDYKDLLAQHHIEGDVWLDLTQEHLSSIGLTNKHHINLILTKRNELFCLSPIKEVSEESKIPQSNELSISYTLVVRAARAQTKNKTDSADFVLRKVKSLDFSSKALTQIQNLNHCCALQCLSLNNNLITNITGLNQLKNLRILSLESNSINKLENLSELCVLEKLYLDFNYIVRLEGLEGLLQLQELTMNKQQISVPMEIDENSVVSIAQTLKLLSLSNNLIQDIGHLWYLDNLKTLDLSNNSIPFCEDLYKVLSCLKSLSKLKLIGNPVSKRPKYRDEMILWSNNLQELDDKNVLGNEREYLYRLKGKRLTSFPKAKCTDSVDLEVKGSKLNN